MNCELNNYQVSLHSGFQDKEVFGIKLYLINRKIISYTCIAFQSTISNILVVKVC